MAEPARKRRESRGEQRKSYRFEDAYAFLESEDEKSDQTKGAPDPEAEDADKEEDPDDFRPEEDDDQEEESIDLDVVDENDLDSELSVEETPRGDWSDDETDPGSPGDGRRKPETLKLSTAPAVALRFRAKRPKTKVRDAETNTRTVGTNKLHSRGVDELMGRRWGGQEARLKALFGPIHDDLKTILLTRDHWERQETLPSRDEGMLRRSFYVPDGAREKEIANMRRWYFSAGKAELAAGQKSSTLNNEKAALYLANPGPESLNVLMGPVKDQKLYSLQKGSYMSTATPFVAEEGRRGWVLNLGSKVQDAQWVPNEEGSTQYLAVAVHQEMTGRKHKPLENPRAPPFSTTKPFPSSIQVWAFEATDKGSLDPTKPPRLELVICGDWGMPKIFRWSPVATADTVESPDDENTIHLGLLAGVWSDGRVRILDVSYQKPALDKPETQYIYYSQTAFDAQVPDTVPTCLQWLSGTSLAVSTAAGTLAVWTLTRAGTLRPRVADYNPHPWFYKQVSNTYILTLSSGWPSSPNHVSYTTADGFAKLLDLRSPITDTSASARGRALILTQTWHDHTQSFIMSDESYLLRNNTIRRYYTNIYSMRLESSIVCLAASPVHPGVLLGGADGMAVAGNPIARVLNNKEIPWQQIWFSHEWRPAVEKLSLKIPQADGKSAGDKVVPSTPGPGGNTNGEGKASSASTKYPRLPDPKPAVPPEALSQPMVRISEGYKVRQVALQQTKPNDVRPDGGKSMAVFEEASAVTTLAWNTNLKFGTWAVAGMGDGLLRVEDLNV